MSDLKGQIEGQGCPVRLAILIPSFDTWDANFCLSLLQMQRYLTYKPVCEDFDYTIINERGSLIANQRENMVKMAIDDERITHILCLDSDMEFPPNLFHRLYSHHLPMVACNYTKRIIPSFPNSRSLHGKLISTTRESRGLEEAESAGFGAVLFQREVFETLERPWFDTVWLDKGEGKIEMMGEDVFFFKKARQVGNYPLFIDHSISQKIKHVGTYSYENWMCETAFEVYGDPTAKEKFVE